MIISLPTEDRPSAHAFYRDGLGFEPFGEPADDGVPEPLQLRVGPDVTLMLIPTGGFGWVLGDRPAAPRGTSECLLTLSLGTPEEVNTLFERAVAAGGDAVAPPAEQPWGYTATLADPDGHVWQLAVGPA